MKLENLIFFILTEEFFCPSEIRGFSSEEVIEVLDNWIAKCYLARYKVRARQSSSEAVSPFRKPPKSSQ